MIYSIEGEVVTSSDYCVVLKNSGVGYYINITRQTYDEIKDSEFAMLYTHRSIREDRQDLYGFLEKSERALFVLLIGVKGVGCSYALKIMDDIPQDEIVQAIQMEESKVFESVKGIGNKTAKSIIEQLKKIF